MAHGKGRLALVLCALAAALWSVPAHATFERFEASGSFDCAPNPPRAFSDHGQNAATLSQSAAFGTGGVNSAETFGFGGISTGYFPTGWPPVLGASSSIQIGADPVASPCTVTGGATSRLTWSTTDALGLPPATTATFVMRIYFDGSIHESDVLPGETASALMSVVASLIDSDGNEIEPLGSMDCGLLGCSSAEFTIDEDSTDTSGAGFRERSWNASTATIWFEAARVGTFTIRFDVLTEALVSGICCLTTAPWNIGSDFGGTLLYEVLSLDPDVSIELEPIPEPAVVSLIGLGLGFLAYLRRRRS
jgi:hypothetical protein